MKMESPHSNGFPIFAPSPNRQINNHLNTFLSIFSQPQFASQNVVYSAEMICEKTKLVVGIAPSCGLAPLGGMATVLESLFKGDLQTSSLRLSQLQTLQQMAQLSGSPNDLHHMTVFNFTELFINALQPFLRDKLNEAHVTDQEQPIQPSEIIPGPSICASATATIVTKDEPLVPSWSPMAQQTPTLKTILTHVKAINRRDNYRKRDGEGCLKRKLDEIISNVTEENGEETNNEEENMISPRRILKETGLTNVEESTPGKYNSREDSEAKRAAKRKEQCRILREQNMRVHPCPRGCQVVLTSSNSIEVHFRSYHSHEGCLLFFVCDRCGEVKKSCHSLNAHMVEACPGSDYTLQVVLQEFAFLGEGPQSEPRSHIKNVKDAQRRKENRHAIKSRILSNRPCPMNCGALHNSTSGAYTHFRRDHGSTDVSLVFICSLCGLQMRSVNAINRHLVEVCPLAEFQLGTNERTNSPSAERTKSPSADISG